MNFNPDDTGVANGNYFGFPFTVEESKLVLISAPWDVTVSYNEGTATAPEAIIEASIQVEIYDPHNPDAWQQGIATLPVDKWIADASEKYRKTAIKVIEHIEEGGEIEGVQRHIDKVNAASRELNAIIYKQSVGLLDKGKLVGLVGGDHSTPLGLMQALATKHEEFGILHIDAHCDLRDAYEGFEFSHASIMFNALKIEQVTKLVQVAVRDFSQTEIIKAQSDPRVVQMSDYSLKEAAFRGETWHMQCEKIIASLPPKVYVSFDIDGLTREYCPSTGTPVPGGLTYNEAIYLLVMLRQSSRTIIGFDLTEVSPSDENEWDANVGARVLYKLCNMTI